MLKNTMNIQISDLTRDLKLLAKQLRTNNEYTALENIQDVLSKITSSPNILINCNLNSLVNINTAMHDCQIKEDWLGLADYLEYDLIRAINPQIESSQI